MAPGVPGRKRLLMTIDNPPYCFCDPLSATAHLDFGPGRWIRRPSRLIVFVRCWLPSKPSTCTMDKRTAPPAAWVAHVQHASVLRFLRTQVNLSNLPRRVERARKTSNCLGLLTRGRDYSAEARSAQIVSRWLTLHKAASVNPRCARTSAMGSKNDPCTPCAAYLLLILTFRRHNAVWPAAPEKHHTCMQTTI